jgi:predicted NUDIX family NTP pyrophosphohydrolase
MHSYGVIVRERACEEFGRSAWYSLSHAAQTKLTPAQRAFAAGIRHTGAQE